MAAGENTVYHLEDEFTWNKELPSKFAVCIPASNEASLLSVFQSLLDCNPINSAAVYCCINNSESAADSVKKVNLKAFEELREFVYKAKPWFAVHVMFYNRLPSKLAGVGLARKLCMDTAAKDMGYLPQAIIACLDADCTVANTYFQSIQQFFVQNSNKVAASIYFEHAQPSNEILALGIEQYELHLRYLKNALKYCGYPWYYHTVGSSMALRAETYKKSGGMNTRQAGEDFYFLHKLMPLGFGEISTTTVFPAARFSDRVPFGTGRSMIEFDKEKKLETYNPIVFDLLKQFFMAFSEQKSIDQALINNLDPRLQACLEAEGILDAWSRCVSNTSSREMAVRQLYNWFSGFRIIRCMHFLRDKGLEQIPVEIAAADLLQRLEIQANGNLLQTYLELDRQ